jgi:sugar lactone lactonase YvrE
VLTALDPSALELPEGVSADSHGDLYVTLAGTGVVLRIGPNGSKTEAAHLTLPPPLGASYIAGIAHDSADAMYLATVSADSAQLASGIYRVPAGGGQPKLFASDPRLSFPNGLTWDDSGHLFVSDNRAGAIFMADATGTLTLWLEHTLLHGDRTLCGRAGATDAGANGVAFARGAIYVANSDHGSIVRIPIQPDGSAGSPETWLAPDCARASLDGIVVVDDVIYAADYSHNAILAVDAERRASVYASSEAFDNPASLVLWEGRGVRELAITNFALDHALAGVTGRPALLTVSLPFGRAR